MFFEIEDWFNYGDGDHDQFISIKDGSVDQEALTSVKHENSMSIAPSRGRSIEEVTSNHSDAIIFVDRMNVNAGYFCLLNWMTSSGFKY